MKIIYIRVPDNFKTDLISIAEIRGERQATIVREILIKGIKKYRKELDTKKKQ